MELLLLAIYSFFVWLIFFKFKWLPWTFVSQVIVITIPIVGITVMILALNVVAPSSHDVRVINYVVQVVPQVTGQITEVPVVDNQKSRRATCSSSIDSVPFALRVKELESQLANTRAVVDQLGDEMHAAREATSSYRVQLALAEKRVQQYKDLVEGGAGNRFDLESAETDVADLRTKIAAAVAQEEKVRKRMSANFGGDQAEVAEIRAQLATARWSLRRPRSSPPAMGGPSTSRSGPAPSPPHCRSGP